MLRYEIKLHELHALHAPFVKFYICLRVFGRNVKIIMEITNSLSLLYKRDNMANKALTTKNFSFVILDKIMK